MTFENLEEGIEFLMQGLNNFSPTLEDSRDADYKVISAKSKDGKPFYLNVGLNMAGVVDMVLFEGSNGEPYRHFPLGNLKKAWDDSLSYLTTMYK